MKMKRLAFLLFLIVFLAGCSDYDQDGNTTSEKAKQKYDVAINQVFKTENQFLKKQQIDRQLKRNTGETGAIVYEDQGLIEIYYDQSARGERAIYQKDGSTYARKTYTKQISRKIDDSEKKYLENIGIK
ncbi:hypothetical protein ASF99_01700 [Exiguobacterium sp. Leaf187]|uniref:membrane lipoprotein lipid attachment site-containing protein n=1 Tax=Exiguobacterium sp. Leaf187 TaxID=1736294 RepID=UPI0006F5D16F|nr:membrane lipoprotein lipid attachment site-containing protein [Exiguobacterium sp. Leaf187]KQS18630.1 hypothetical protein ASF99_01700 [Exiguobacterium sp. Leaf187]